MFRLRWFVPVLLLVILGSAVVFPVQAATFDVTRTDDPTPDGCAVGDCSLREAIIAANGSANNIVNLPAGTYTLSIAGAGEDAAATGDLDITQPMTINGAGSGSTIIRGCDDTANAACTGIDRIFDVLSGDVTLTSLTIRKGNAPASSPYATNRSSGGGISVADGAALTVTGVTVENSTSYAYGGGVYLDGGSLEATNLIVRNNTTGSNGGGIAGEGGATVTLTDSTVEGNIGDGFGGGILIVRSTLTLNNSTVRANTNSTSSQEYGGGIAAEAATVNLNSSTIGGPDPSDGNIAGSPGFGGGLYLNRTTANIYDSVIQNNRTQGGSTNGNGGAIYAEAYDGTSVTINIVRSIIADNSSGSTGGIRSGGYAATYINIVNSLISGNYAYGTYANGSGALFQGGPGTIQVFNSTITGNEGGRTGSGAITSNTCSACSAGGGPSVFIVNSTVVNNVGLYTPIGSGVGGLRVNHGSITTRNSIVGGNMSRTDSTGTEVESNCAGVTSGGYNIFGQNGNAGGCTTTTGDITPTGALSSFLGPLQNNGGPTATYALLDLGFDAGSNALIPVDTFDLDGDSNMSEPLPFDQRGSGFPRVRGGTVDIGAFEGTAVPQMTVSKDDGQTEVLRGETLTYGIEFENGTDRDPAHNVVIRDTLPAGTTYTGCSFVAPAAGSCSHSSGVVTFTLSGTVAGGANGAVEVSVTVNADASGDLTNTVTLDYEDADGNAQPQASDSDTTTVLVPNAPPSFTPGGDVTVAEDSGAYSDTWATDVSPGPASESGQTVMFNVSNDNNALFSSQPAIASDGTLTFTPATDAFGSAMVTVFAQDNGGTANGGDDTSESETFTITVQPVNDPPSFTLVGDLSVNENAGAQSVTGFASSISPGPANESGQTVTFNVSNDNNALFSSQPAIDSSGTLTFTPADSLTGEAVVTVFAQDNGGTANGGDDTSDAQTFRITVSDVGAAIEVTKAADTTTLDEPGGDVTFTITVRNTSTIDSVTIDTLSDDLHGDLNGQGSCSVPQSIPPTQSYTCMFTVTYTGVVDDSFTDTASASGQDDDGEAVSDSSDPVTVSIGNVASSLSVIKSVDRDVVTASGETASFTVTVTNTSATDTVDVTTLTDTIIGVTSFDLNGVGTCALPQTLTPGSDYTCEFTMSIDGAVGDTVEDTVEAAGTDDDGDPVSGVSNVVGVSIGAPDDDDSEPLPPGPPAETFLCANLNAMTNGAMTGSGGQGNAVLNGVVGDTYCRPLAVNGVFVQSSAEIGEQSLLDMGVMQAVDVFGLLPGGVSAVEFTSSVRICLQGQPGVVFFLDAATWERDLRVLPAMQEGSLVCVDVPNAGTVVLVR